MRDGQRTGLQRLTLRRTAAIQGALIVGVFLGTSELLSSLLPGAVSALVSWGRLIIQTAPRASVDVTIRTLGSSDKTALTLFMIVLACGLGALVAALSRGRPAVVTAGIAALAFLDAGAALPVPGTTPLSTTLAIAGASGAAIAAWRLCVGRLTAAALATRVGQDERSIPRRRFLGLTIGLGATALVAGVAGRVLLSGMAVAAARARIRLPRAVSPAPPIARTVADNVPGIAPLITPNATFYRIDTALLPPSLDPLTWRLRIEGRAGNPHQLSFADLLAMPMEEQIVTLCCVSNEVGGPLVGTARWLGVPLRKVLAAARPDTSATELVGRSVDGFTASFPLAMALDGRPAMVAVGMNGEPLPFEHGFPARLVVAGLYGFTSAVKWLDRLELATSSSQQDGYWVQRGWTPDAPIRTESRIDVPSTNTDVASGPTAVAGVAWAPGHGVELVEVQGDDGPWRRCSLGADLGPWAWRHWSVTWDAHPGRHVLRVRATAVGGATQDPGRSDPFPRGATGLHEITVRGS